jgi:protein-S-isoprenylcysteine O-methyltransferase Ste14
VTAAAALVAAAGSALAAQGARDLGRDLTPFVEPRAGAGLRTTGAYAASRHPVYAGLLSGSAALAVLRRRPEPLAAVAVLAAVLHRKAAVEEGRLRARFGPAYDEYAARTPRLLGVPRRRRAGTAVRTCGSPGTPRR